MLLRTDSLAFRALTTRVPSELTAGVLAVALRRRQQTLAFSPPFRQRCFFLLIRAAHRPRVVVRTFHSSLPDSTAFPGPCHLTVRGGWWERHSGVSIGGVAGAGIDGFYIIVGLFVSRVPPP